MRRFTYPALFAALLAVLCALASSSPADVRAGGLSFYCAWDASCPEVTIAGDPYAEISGGPAPFRGYGDPSLELEPDTGDLWLSYSWLDVRVSSPGPPPVIDFGVRTHLARSTDGGATWAFERAVNATLPIAHPDTSADGWTIHEVSTLARRGPGDWESLWFTYFEPFGPPARSDFYYTQSVATSPEGLGDVSTPWVRTNGTSASWGAVHNLGSMPELSDCTVLTEPGLFAYSGETYLLSSCVVFIGAARHPELERLVLLREETSGYSYAGELLDYADAVDMGGERVEQADLAVAQNGAILLIVTPIQAVQPEHLGCIVLEVTDIATAQVRLDVNGGAVRLYEITGEDSTIGPGLCAYDATSDTGVLMVLHGFTPSPLDVEFSLRATGVHPLGLDTDSDGLADTADANDDNDAFSDVLEIACGSGPLVAASIPERVDGVFAVADDDGDTTVDEALLGGASGSDCDRDGYIGSAESHVFSATGGQDQDPCGGTAWPTDLNSTGLSANDVDIQDLSAFIVPTRRLNTSPGDGGYDVRWDVVPGTVTGKVIDIQDLSSVALVAPAMLGGSQRAYNGPSCPWPP